MVFPVNVFTKICIDGDGKEQDELYYIMGSSTFSRGVAVETHHHSLHCPSLAPLYVMHLPLGGVVSLICPGDCEDPNPKQLEHGHTRPYKIQREFERFKIGASDYSTGALMC
jgi:hypothetical protein